MEYVIMRPSEARALQKAEAANNEKPKKEDFDSDKEFFAALTKWKYSQKNKAGKE